MGEHIEYFYDFRALSGRKPKQEGVREALAFRQQLVRVLQKGGRLLEATLKVGQALTPVTITGMDGDGLVVEPAPPLHIRERTVVTIKCAENGTEYFLPADAVWKTGQGSGSAMGLLFVGAPVAVAATPEPA